MRFCKPNRVPARACAAVLVAAFAVSCESATPDAATVVDQKAKNVPAAPAADKGVQFVGPKLTIAAGDEKQLCWVPDWTPEKDYMIRRFKGFQGTMGHHVVALNDIGGTYKAGQTFDCTSVTQMVNLRPLVLPEPDPHGDKTLLQEGYAVRLPKGVRPVFQSHYVNYGSKPIEIQDVARIEFATEANPVEVSYFIVNDSLVDVAATGETTRSMTCKVPSDIKLLATLGHMHEMGSTIKVEHSRPLDAAFKPATMFNIAKWMPEFRDSGPIEVFGVGATSLDLKAGDEVKITCTWKNTSGKQLFFPKEMCVTVSYYYPALKEGVILCNN